MQPAQFHRHIGEHSGNTAPCPITATQAGHSGLVDGESIISGLGASSLYVARTSLCPHTDDRTFQILALCPFPQNEVRVEVLLQ